MVYELDAASPESCDWGVLRHGRAHEAQRPRVPLYEIGCGEWKRTNCSMATAGTGPEVYTWTGKAIVRLDDLIRAHPKTAGSHYYKATSVTVDAHHYDATTGESQPTFSGTTVVETTAAGTVTWTDQGVEAASFVIDGDAIWVDIGPTPTYAAYAETIDPRKLTKSISTGTVILTPAEFAHKFIELTGTLTGNVTIEFPSSSTLKLLEPPVVPIG